MTKTVEFYFDLGSPATYLAYTQLPKICAQTGSELIYIPMLLGGVFKATGNASPAMIPAKGRYMFEDLDRYAKRYDVPLTFNPHFPINTLMLMRAVTGIQNAFRPLSIACSTLFGLKDAAWMNPRQSRQY
jgi:2-hydroxychromene-2-carboxylate isomerase